jgi:CheY-like chemotaxis protein
MKQKNRILVIDDEAGIRALMKSSPEGEAGKEVLTACSGADGLAKARAMRPDAILLDVTMPGMDRLATFRELQADTAT